MAEGKSISVKEEKKTRQKIRENPENSKNSKKKEKKKDRQNSNSVKKIREIFIHSRTKELQSLSKEEEENL